MKKNNYKISIAIIVIICGMAAGTGCKKSFLQPDPLSFYEPATTFSTESGLTSAIATCDKHLRSYWSYYSTRDLSLPISSEYMLSDLAVAGKTDDGAIFADVATRLTPSDGLYENDVNMLSYFWEQNYDGIKYANTITTYIDNVEGLDDATKNEYIGRAYFHRSFRYMALCFLFDNVPLVTKILSNPKQSYKSTSHEAILEMITSNMEFAVQWVPEQSEMSYIGMVSKGACRQLLIKCYLATGQWDKAIAEADTLINNEGYALMTTTFGTFEDPFPTTWPITRNVIWDLHRPVNKCIVANTESILSMPNESGTDAAIAMRTMRNWGPFWNTSTLKSPAGYYMQAYATSSSNYNSALDFNSAVGRGIAAIRPTYFAQHGLWEVNGVEDTDDLRHNSSVGNWARMDSLKYNDPSDVTYYGQNLRLYNGSTLLCTDTVRDWFDWPHYKVFVTDPDHTASTTSTNNKGGAANWYCYRLAETYLLRAEAEFYKGDVSAATADVNIIRSRAGCSQLYSTVTIGDIVNERARELYMEEWRHTELSRISYCLALSGKSDEWGNTYSTTSLSDNSYWYQRIQHYSDYYNKGNVTVKGRYYTIDPHNIYLPVPQDAIDANLYGTLWQNKGYDGYDAGISMWTNWEDAVADEDITN
ncbi:RagB/SusD family nutrient uptake outer membrane protein [Parafilimonas sp.]|uniref:RagB/SusD family nutrient uptake outer membrane protein n=1 Tax=Parafilimonas sp. TaxID=1969739 RepID=UPI0039E2E38F